MGLVVCCILLSLKNSSKARYKGTTAHTMMKLEYVLTRWARCKNLEDHNVDVEDVIFEDIIDRGDLEDDRSEAEQRLGGSGVTNKAIPPTKRAPRNIAPTSVNRAHMDLISGVQTRSRRVNVSDSRGTSSSHVSNDSPAGEVVDGEAEVEVNGAERASSSRSTSSVPAARPGTPRVPTTQVMSSAKLVVQYDDEPVDNEWSRSRAL